MDVSQFKKAEPIVAEIRCLEHVLAAFKKETLKFSVTASFQSTGFDFNSFDFLGFKYIKDGAIKNLEERIENLNTQLSKL